MARPRKLPDLDRRSQEYQNEALYHELRTTSASFPRPSPWDWIRDTFKKETTQRREPLNFLNLFAYSGGATLPQHKAALIAVTSTPPGVWLNGHERTPS